MIKSEPVPLGGDSEEKGDYMGRDLAWGVSSSSHKLGAPVLESDMEDEPPWLVGEPLEQEGCGKRVLHFGGVCKC